MSSFEDFKYERPVLYRSIIALLVVAAVVGIGASVPDSEATRAMGLIALRDRVNALQQAAYWQARSVMSPAGVLVPRVDYGFVIGVDFDGRIFVTIPDKKEFVQSKVRLADIQITDLRGVALLISEKRQSNARFEMYGDMAVVWIDDIPLNVELVNLGVAIPDPNPPTDIVDRIFAAYFWKKVKGQSK